jgi:hypothetical protein
MGALFLASGASTGMAAIWLLMFVTGASSGEGWGKGKKADRFSMMFEVIVLAGFLFVLGSAAKPITRGHFAPLFWGRAGGRGAGDPADPRLRRSSGPGGGADRRRARYRRPVSVLIGPARPI